ncbi:MAG: hypothetical protein ABIQ16_28870, partial [Polyangiaceae bacterium]
MTWPLQCVMRVMPRSALCFWALLGLACGKRLEPPGAAREPSARAVAVNADGSALRGDASATSPAAAAAPTSTNQPSGPTP